MGDYTLREIEEWNKRIEKLVKEQGLDYYEQEFEIVNDDDMMAYEAYTGMPSHYPHWSYGKAYERIKTLNQYNLSGLPYEMVINSDPCIAYLMKDNTLLLQILTIAHVYGHNDFFKNNRLFKEGTQAKYTVEVFKNHARRVREYISNPGIGYKKVEKILDAAHAIKFQMSRVIGEKRLTEQQQQEVLYERVQKPLSQYPLLEPAHKEEESHERENRVNWNKIPISPEEDLLGFISKYGALAEWERDLINIVREEALYFLPQIETKIMNEGWASYWHYTILNKLELPQGLHLEFLKRHNQVIRPFEGQINPYYVGFKIFEDLAARYGMNKIFEVRTLERDQSFIRRYLTHELCAEMNLFQYGQEKNEYVIEEVSDEEGWKEIRDSLALTVGMGNIPVIQVTEKVQKNNTLMLEHRYDGRELEMNYALQTLKHIAALWDGNVVLATTIEGQKKMLMCDESRNITLKK